MRTYVIRVSSLSVILCLFNAFCVSATDEVRNNDLPTTFDSCCKKLNCSAVNGTCAQAPGNETCKCEKEEPPLPAPVVAPAAAKPPPASDEPPATKEAKELLKGECRGELEVQNSLNKSLLMSRKELAKIENQMRMHNESYAMDIDNKDTEIKSLHTEIGNLTSRMNITRGQLVALTSALASELLKMDLSTASLNEELSRLQTQTSTYSSVVMENSRAIFDKKEAIEKRIGTISTLNEQKDKNEQEKIVTDGKIKDQVDTMSPEALETNQKMMAETPQAQ